jgi:uncharacterized membrane protein
MSEQLIHLTHAERRDSPVTMRGNTVQKKIILMVLCAFYLSACGTVGGDRAIFGGLAGGNAGAVIGSFYGDASKGVACRIFCTSVIETTA